MKSRNRLAKVLLIGLLSLNQPTKSEGYTLTDLDIQVKIEENKYHPIKIDKQSISISDETTAVIVGFHNGETEELLCQIRLNNLKKRPTIKVTAGPLDAGNGFQAAAEGMDNSGNPRSSTEDCKVFCPSGYHSETGYLPCKKNKDCLEGEEIDPTKPSTTTKDRECRKCEDEFYSDTINSDECIPHQVCESDEYVDSKPSVKTGTVCAKLTNCKPGEKIKTKATPISDRVCTECESGHYSNKENVDKCIPWTDKWTECDNTEVQIKGTSTQDGVCVQCGPGTYTSKVSGATDGKLFECMECDERTESKEDHNTECKSCEPGYIIEVDSIECTPCGEGYYQKDNTCFKITDCESGAIVSVSPFFNEGVAFSNRVCKTCPSGSTSEGVNAAECEDKSEEEEEWF